MNESKDILANLGKPDLSICAFHLWITARSYPDSYDYWDGNWLNVVANCSSQGAAVTVIGTLIHLPEIVRLRKVCSELHRTSVGAQEIAFLEPNLHMKFDLGHTDKGTFTLRITPDHMSQHHEFEFSIDQSFLSGIVSQCDGILAKFPIKNAPDSAGARFQATHRGSGDIG